MVLIKQKKYKEAEEVMEKAFSIHQIDNKTKDNIQNQDVIKNNAQLNIKINSN